MEKIMGIVINKKEKTMSMTDAWIVEDLSSWELVEPSDDENEQDYSYDDDDEEIDLYVFESLPSDLAAQSPAQDLVDHASGQEDRVDLVKRVSVDEKCVYTVTEAPLNAKLWLHPFVYNDYNDGNDDEEEEEEERYDDYEGYYDLDDELVPKNVIDRFGRQRIRKLGKRAFSKMNKAKRLPYAYNRPGCVYGKHGLGLKHNIIS